MKRFLALLLTLCLCVSTGLAETVTTPTDMEPAATAPVEPTAEPTVEPTAEPTEEAPADPTAEPTEEAPAEPTAEPTEEAPAEPTAEPTEEASAEPTAEPTEEAPADSTAEPTEEIPADPTAEPAPETTAAPSPVDGPLYVLVDGVKIYGQPDTLIPLGLVIYLYDDSVVELIGYSADELSKIAFALDPEVFTDADDCIYLSVRDPDGFVKQDTFFLWAGKKGDMTTATPAPPVSDEVVEHEILVTALDYSASAPCRPTFLLASAPALEDGMTFAVIVNDGAAQRLNADSYVPGVSGTYRFALLAADGSVLHRSAKFTVTIPAPEPTAEPTADPTVEPTIEPTAEPTADPTVEPTIEPTAEPTADPTVEPTIEPTAEPTADPTVEPTIEPTAEPTADPTVEPTIEPTAEPTADPTVEPTIEPTAEPTAEPTVEPTIEPTAAPAFPDSQTSAQAWATDGDAYSDGDLADMLQKDSNVIYILTDRIIVLDGGYAQLSGKTLLPDPERFGDDYIVRISSENEDVERADSLFVWVELKGMAAVTAVTLQVETDSFVDSAWSSIIPGFILSANPSLTELAAGYAYAVSMDGGAPIILSDSIYTAAEEGQYTLQFMLLAPDGSIAASSDSYSVWLDYTVPLLQVQSGNGTLQITVGDALSGGDAVSLDGGETWNALVQGEDGVATYSHSVAETQVFAAGSIVVRDLAGGLTVYPADVTVRKSSGGGRGSSSNRSTSHSASTEESVTAYDGVELILEDGSMSQLTLGEETLDLLLTYTGEANLPADAQPAFTAQFTDLTQDGIQDTLALAAVGVSDERAKDYTWSFSGLVCKKLSASGIDYLMLRTGDQVTVLTTAGFTAGLRYNMHRAEGLVSKDFFYELCMSAETGLALHVTVSEATYAMSDDPAAEMYYYDLFYGNMAAFEEAVRMYQNEVTQ